MSWLEESDEDNLGNESHKKLFEDADLNDVCNAVTEEEETDDVNALGGMPFEETDDFKVDADDVNALPPVTEMSFEETDVCNDDFAGGGLNKWAYVEERYQQAIAAAALLSPEPVAERIK